MTVPHKMVELERMSDYRGVGVKRFHCIYVCTYAVRDCSDNNTYVLFAQGVHSSGVCD